MDPAPPGENLDAIGDIIDYAASRGATQLSVDLYKKKFLKFQLNVPLTMRHIHKLARYYGGERKSHIVSRRFARALRHLGDKSLILCKHPAAPTPLQVEGGGNDLCVALLRDSAEPAGTSKACCCMLDYSSANETVSELWENLQATDFFRSSRKLHKYLSTVPDQVAVVLVLIKNIPTRIIHISEDRRDLHVQVTSQSVLPYTQSLTDYLRALYLVPRIALLVRGTPVRTQPLVRSLRYSSLSTYSCQPGVPCAPGAPSHSTTDLVHACSGISHILSKSGVYLYSDNRLVNALVPTTVNTTSTAASADFFLVCIVDVSSLPMYSDCREFVPSLAYRGILSVVIEQFQQLALEAGRPQQLCGTDQFWFMCLLCTKWRRHPTTLETCGQCTDALGMRCSDREEELGPQAFGSTTTTFTKIKRKPVDELDPADRLEIVLSDVDSESEQIKQLRSELSYTKKRLERLQCSITDFLNILVPGGVKSTNSPEELQTLLKIVVHDYHDCNPQASPEVKDP